MKFRLLSVVGLAMMLFFSSCSNQPAPIETDRGVFENAGSLTDFDFDKASQFSLPNATGMSRANALVPLVFDAEGHLLTAAEYDEGNGSGNTIQYTDLKTYKKVMKDLARKGKQPQGRVDEIKEAFVHELPISNESPDGLTTTSAVEDSIYAFDPYEIKHLTEAEIEAIYTRDVDTAVNQEISTQSFGSASVWVADIAVRKPGFNITGNTGHAGVVTQLSCTTTLDCGGNPNSAGTKVMEANKGESPADDLSESPLLEHFDPDAKKDPIYLLRADWLLSSQQRNIRNFALRQDPGRYKVNASKDANCDGLSSCRWYCSLLVWKAYKLYTGVSLDPGKGYWVWPYDLIDSSYTRTYYKE